jgi:glycerol transport system substrate-binding protein
MGPARVAVLAAALAGAWGCGKKDEGGGGSGGTQPPPRPDPAAQAGREAAIQKWVGELQPSTLSRDKQIAELRWFMEAAKPFAGMNIKVVSETIDTHVYESKTLAKAFSEITGINVIHDLLQEGDVIEKLQTQMQSGTSIYDMYVNDTDLIGTHYRYGDAVPLTDFMAGEGKQVTSPTLD